jgi:hypothetical protein
MPHSIIKEGFSDDETEIALNGKLNDGMTTVYSRSAFARYKLRHSNDMQAIYGFLFRPYSIRTKSG